jgi:hypothetical protein
MIRNEIDEFRLRVLQEMVEAEQRKERERQRQQRNCFHRYRPTEEGTVECTKCSKRK